MSENALKPSDIAGKPLYEIASEYGDLLDRLEDIAEENQGIIPDDLADDFESLEGAVEVKLENCSMVVRALKIQSETVKSEEVRLRDLRKSIDASALRLKDYMTSNMLRIGKTRSDGELLKVRTRKNPPKALIVDINKVPDEYVVIETKMTAAQLATIKMLISESDCMDDFTEEWKIEKSVPTKPIIDEWKKSSGVFEVDGIVITQNSGVRIW